MIEFPHLMQAVMALVAISSLVTTIIMTRGKAAADKVAELERTLGTKAGSAWVSAIEGRLNAVEDRVSRVESRLEHTPDKDVSHRLEMAIARLEGRMETMDERLKPVAEMAARVHERMFDREH